MKERDTLEQEAELFLEDILVSDLCVKFNMEYKGLDRVIKKVGTLDTKTSRPGMGLTYAFSKEYVQKFIESDFQSCIIPYSLERYTATETKTFLLTDVDAEIKFYEIVTQLNEENKWEKVDAFIGKDNIISPSAAIYENVMIGNNCIIMDNVVIRPNTIIGNNIIIKPNTVIGGDGFLVKKVSGTNKIIPHFGGVKIEDNVEIGSNVCIDKGMFGEFTFIDAYTKIDNLVHIGHSVRIGKECIITAGNVIGGSTMISENVWLGINSTINQLLNIGKSCFIGSGTVVRKSLNPNLLVAGSPAKIIGKVCHCRSKLETLDEGLFCAKCNIKYKIIDNALEESN